MSKTYRSEFRTVSNPNLIWHESQKAYKGKERRSEIKKSRMEMKATLKAVSL